MTIRTWLMVLAVSPWMEAGSAANGGQPDIGVEQGKLEPGAMDPGALFGTSVSLDGATALIGAPGTPGAGVAFVFTRDMSDVWSQAAILSPVSPIATGDQFGESVRLDGDTLIVGAPFNDGVATDAGAAYVYTGSGSSWSHEATLTASDGSTDDLFGLSVSLSGDTALIGAPGTLGSANNAAYVFVRSGTTWTQEAKLTSSNATGSAVFGSAVAISDDVAVIGAPNDHAPTINFVGTAFVFSRSGTTWTEQSELIASDAAAGDEFGHSVEVDLDGMGAGSIIIGAPESDNSGATGSGSAYVFVGSGSSWTEEVELVGIQTIGNNAAGTSVSIDGDTAAVGAPIGPGNVPGSATGRAFVFERCGTTWSQQGTQLRGSGGLSDDAVNSDRAGTSVSVCGDVVLVGAPKHTLVSVMPKVRTPGKAFVYVRAETSPTFYCTGKTTSGGCIPFLETEGVPSLVNDFPFRIIGRDHVPDEAGVLLYNFQKANLNFHGGKLCVKAGYTRIFSTAEENQTCVDPFAACGTTSCRRIVTDFNTRIQSGSDPCLTLGQTVYAQMLQRDPTEPQGFEDNLTDGVQFVISP